MFKVQQSEESCVRDADAKFPSFAYLSTKNTEGLFSIFLSSNDGCDQVALLDNAPSAGTPDGGGVVWMKLVYQAPAGAVFWTESLYQRDVHPDQERIWGLKFEVINGVVYKGSPVLIKETEIGAGVYPFDAHMDSTGNIKIAYPKYSGSDTHPWTLNLLTGMHIDQFGSWNLHQQITDECLVQDLSGACFGLRIHSTKFNIAGDSLYFYIRPYDLEGIPFGRIKVSDSGFGNVEAVVKDEVYNPWGLSPDESTMIFGYEKRHKNGRFLGYEIRVLPFDYCFFNPCNKADGPIVVGDTGDDYVGLVRWQSATDILWEGPKESPFNRVESLRRYSFTENIYKPTIRLLAPVDELDTLQ